MIHEIKLEVKILRVEIDNGVPRHATVSIDNTLSEKYGPETFGIEEGKEITIHGGQFVTQGASAYITKDQIDLLFYAWERVKKLNFESFSTEILKIK